MKIFKKVLIVLAVLILTSGLAIHIYLSGKNSQRDGTLILPGLTTNVEIIFDRFGIPHIYADNDADAFRALGYVHAQDRLFQMELTRRLARGELAEILGPKLVKTDKFFRTLRIKSFAKEYTAFDLVNSSPLDSWVDFNLGIEYHYTKKLSIFADFHNIGNTSYIRWHNYPVQKFSVIGGLSYSF